MNNATRQLVLYGVVLLSMPSFSCDVMNPFITADPNRCLLSLNTRTGVGGPKFAASLISTELLEIYVDPNDGNDTSGTGESDAPFQTITGAMKKLGDYSALLAGATIYMKSGVYAPFHISNIPLYNGSRLTLQAWDPNDANAIIVDGGADPGDPYDANDPNRAQDAIAVDSTGTVCLNGISVIRGNSGISILDSDVWLTEVRVDGTSSCAIQAIGSTIAMDGNFAVGEANVCGAGMELVGSQAMTGPNGPAALAITANDTAILASWNSSVYLIGRLTITTNGNSDGIEAAYSSSLEIISPHLSITGNASGSIAGIDVYDNSSASLFVYDLDLDPNDPNLVEDPNSWPVWTIQGYGQAGIASKQNSNIGMAYGPHGSLTITGIGFGSDFEEAGFSGGIVVSNGSLFTDRPLGDANGVTIVHDFQNAVLCKAQSTCLIWNIEAGIENPNKLTGTNNTAAFSAWNSYLSIDHVLREEGVQYLCYGIATLAEVIGKAEAHIGIEPNVACYANNPSHPYVLAARDGRIFLESSTGDSTDEVTFETNDPNSSAGAGVFVFADESGHVNLGGLTARIENFRTAFSLANGSTCEAVVGSATRVQSDPDGVASQFASVSGNSDIRLQVLGNVGDASHGWDTFCAALDGSRADLMLRGFVFKDANRPDTSAMVSAATWSTIKVAGGTLSDGDDPNDPNKWALLVLPNADDPNYVHFETQQASSIISGEDGVACWGYLRFDPNTTDPNAMRVINGDAASPGFDPNRACYVSVCP